MFELVEIRKFRIKCYSNDGRKVYDKVEEIEEDEILREIDAIAYMLEKNYRFHGVRCTWEVIEEEE